MNDGLKPEVVEIAVDRRSHAGPVASPDARRTVAERPVFRLDLLNCMRRSPRLFFGVAAVVAMLLIGAALRIKPAYEAEALVYVDPQPNKLLGDGTSFFDPMRYASVIQQEVQTATRMDTLLAAVRSLPPGVWRVPGETVEHAAGRLIGLVSVKRVGESFQLSISMKGPNAEDTTAVVNAVTDAFLSQGRKDRNATTEERLKLLAEERERLQRDLEQAHAEQARLSTSLGVAVPSGETPSNPYDTTLAGTRTELIVAEQAHDVAVAALASIRDRNGEASPGLQAQAADLVAADTGLQALKTATAQRRAQLGSLMAGMTPENSNYRVYQAELAQLDGQIQARTAQLERQAEERMVDKAELEVERTGAIESRLRAQVGSGATAAGQAAPKLQRSSELAAEVKRLEARFATVDDTMRGLVLEETGPGMAHLAVPAIGPAGQTASKRKLLLLGAIPAGLILGALSTIVAALFARRVLTVVDADRALGFQTTAVLPRPAEVGSEAMEECLLRLAGALERAQRTTGARSFLFVPVSRGTGTEGLMEGLAKTLRGLGYRVRLGRAEQLVDRPENETAAGERMQARQRLAQWSRTSEFVLLEGAPLLLSAASEYGARSAEATVLVVESGRALRSEARQASALLTRLGIGSVGAVLVNVPVRVLPVEMRAAVAVVKSSKQDRGQTEETRMIPRETLSGIGESGQRVEESALTATAILPAERTPQGETQAVETEGAKGATASVLVDRGGAKKAAFHFGPGRHGGRSWSSILPAWLTEALEPVPGTTEMAGFQPVSFPRREDETEQDGKTVLPGAVPVVPEIEEPVAATPSPKPRWTGWEMRAPMLESVGEEGIGREAAQRNEAWGGRLELTPVEEPTLIYERAYEASYDRGDMDVWAGEQPAMDAVERLPETSGELQGLMLVPSEAVDDPAPKEEPKRAETDVEPAAARLVERHAEAERVRAGVLPMPQPGTGAVAPAVSKVRESGRWQLLRRFDPSSEQFSQSAREVPAWRVPEEEQDETEWIYRSGSGA